MPTATFNRKVFETLAGTKLPDEELKDRISYLGTDLESITADEITVEIFPNRPDLLSVQGFARAFATFIGKQTGLKKYAIQKSGHRVIIEPSVEDVPFTACAIVKGIPFDDERIKEIIQIQEKLHITYGRNRRKCAIGIYPFEKITPPIRFLAKEPDEIIFQPLEFRKEITARQILSMHPAGRTYGHLLEGLARYPIFVDSKDNILSMPPIINSHAVGKITEETRDVFIECSGFDYSVQSTCLNMIVTALADMGGKIYSMELAYGKKKIISPDLSPMKMHISPEYISKRLGFPLSEKKIAALLARMGHGYADGHALVPAYRSDVLHQIDLAEDIAIAYGYENIKEEVPKVATIGSEDPLESFKRKIGGILSGIGILECKHYHLTSKENQVSKMNASMPVITLANSVNAEYNVLSAWNIPFLLDVLERNRHREYPQRIFSIGTVFSKGDSETGVLEQERLACLLCAEDADYTRIRQILDYLFRMIDIPYKVEATTHPSFIPGRVGRGIAKGKKIAYLGEISPDVLEKFGLTMPVCAFELNLTELHNIM